MFETVCRLTSHPLLMFKWSQPLQNSLCLYSQLTAAKFEVRTLFCTIVMIIWHLWSLI